MSVKGFPRGVEKHKHEESSCAGCAVFINLTLILLTMTAVEVIKPGIYREVVLRTLVQLGIGE